VSASRLWFGRIGDTLVHTDEESLRFIRRMEEGESVPFKPLRPLSIKFHRRYWLMVSRIADHITGIQIDPKNPKAVMPVECAEDLHVGLKFLTGHCKVFHVEGTDITYRVPLPTDFSSLNADEWGPHYEKCLQAIHTYALPQIRDRFILEEMERLAS